ncbi:hypothetical protein QBC41DRAFT_344920 [Cercophora samala]|uniref:Uncharacterized protein n=1 Tax=Cercophora samala TaxID=330535 RepID=A0AA39ZHE5_9PEZI|nr:hypothetical protein QBC41DRAFT_344920 [Cercophora samala]
MRSLPFSRNHAPFGGVDWAPYREVVDLDLLYDAIKKLSRTSRMVDVLLPQEAVRTLYKVHMPFGGPQEYAPFKLNTLIKCEAALIQTRGLLAETECQDCTQGKGPFLECVSYKGFAKGSCASCHYTRGSRCSFRSQDPPSSGSTLPEAGKTGGDINAAVNTVPAGPTAPVPSIRVSSPSGPAIPPRNTGVPLNPLLLSPKAPGPSVKESSPPGPTIPHRNTGITLNPLLLGPTVLVPLAAVSSPPGPTMPHRNTGVAGQPLLPGPTISLPCFGELWQPDNAMRFQSTHTTLNNKYPALELAPPQSIKTEEFEFGTEFLQKCFRKGESFEQCFRRPGLQRFLEPGTLCEPRLTGGVSWLRRDVLEYHAETVQNQVFLLEDVSRRLGGREPNAVVNLFDFPEEVRRKVRYNSAFSWGSGVYVSTVRAKLAFSLEWLNGVQRLISRQS